MSDLYARILEANDAIRPQVPVTPLSHSAGLSSRLGCTVFLKLDFLQPTGAFKLRGATNKIARLKAEGATGVFTASTGNHGIAAARAGALAGLPVTVFVAPGAPEAKLEAIRAYGARLEEVPGAPMDAELAARRRAAAEGVAYMSPYNDLDVVAGQGTLGVELMRQEPELDAVFVSVGGGGLVSGVGAAVKAISPATTVVGVWPENSPCMLRALEAGRLHPVEERPTLSEATSGAIERGSVTFPLCQLVIDQRTSVTEPEIAEAMRLVATTDNWMVEGAAGVALAGLAKTAANVRDKRVAVVLCGRNVALDTYLAAVGETHAPQPPLAS